MRTGINLVVSKNNKAIKLGGKISEAEAKFTNYFGVVTGAGGLGKGLSDTVVAVACNDGICAVVSGIGCVADTLQMLTTFVPGPNVTVYLTAPVSICCKTFTAG